uniref:F-box/LRR-repeat protein At5g02910-like n=1 Tax=Erigeron canadensis TaxID=72917 RepID=UPI001CB9B130|nr:F-box/LRR-repeat protein At5g02910-like [Erigeron canadensis]
MKKSRRSNAPREEDVCRISNLPDPILHLILSGLESTEEAIRTSILSKRWRDLWTSAPSLDMDCSKPLKNPNEFKNIVDQVLKLRIDNWIIGRVEGLCGALKVVCPKLVYFEYHGHISKRFSFDVQSLKKAVIHPRNMLKKDGVEYLGITICDLFAGVSHVESLSVNHYFVECMDAKKDYSASLPNLKTLELTIDGFTVNVVIRFLKWSPNLESLHLIFLERFKPHEFKTLVQELDDVETRRKLTHHLKTVKFLEFYGQKKKMALARLLLEHGNALEKMVFSWRNSVRNHKRTMEIMN